MKPGLKLALVATALAGVLALASACGSEGVQVNDRGAHLFAERCAGCHTLAAAGTHGSAGERISGPNLNYRKETPTTVLYASVLRNARARSSHSHDAWPRKAGSSPTHRHRATNCLRFSIG